MNKIESEDTSTTSGWIFNIQRYSIQDGPGIRTTVFFSGCPLECLWCCNPESQTINPKLFYFESRCTRCQHCVSVCPNGAISVHADGSIKTNRNLCNAYGTCVEACPNEARAISGELKTVYEVLEVVKKDSLFYRNSGGGVTASGGEPTSQPKFLLALFQACRRSGFHTCLDTCGYVSWEVLEHALEYTDLVLYDIKHMDPKRHIELTGVDNELILQNAGRVAKNGIPLVIRVPLIPGCNDSKENMEALAKYAIKLGVREINLLPYHELGVNKYERLGMKYDLAATNSFQKNRAEAIKGDIARYNLEVTII